MASTSSKKPWHRQNPKPAGKRRHLTPKQKAGAKAAARKGGRQYPNLVDNMNAAKKRGRNAG